MIRLAIIGLGKIARDQHLPAVAANPGFELAAIVSRSASMSNVPVFDTIDAMIAAGADVDAVAICTPPQVRGPIARAAIDAGMAVMLEKPPAATLAEFEDLRRRAEQAGTVLFATWHSRHAAMVSAARDWIAANPVADVTVRWREDVRKWHPGQQWLWQPGGLGVFDPGINALSILTAILPDPVWVEGAVLSRPENCQTPIAAALDLRSGATRISADFDFREQGDECWSITAHAAHGGRMVLDQGGARLAIDGGAPRSGAEAEYPGLYARFAELVANGVSDADPAPLRLVADAFMVARTERVEAFIE
ncbi:MULTISPECIES: Gfo/Idh/MocA family protein [unclassified Sphingomonas]|jgi:D-galactose 1-dehydrogenase|uniref:Gfo/Idh/MocA family protein n=1 Tax=unclassified Sphingomonas TaxID=196159 RepID=UPI0008367A00|nr:MULTISPECIES: Gfo/Idh/MocA family oxidoreductase [unclassified Sphingomonas]